MSNSNELRYWELTTGGTDGGIHLNGAAAATGLQAQMIDVINPAIFTTLLGYDNRTAAVVNYLTANGLTGITRGEGFLWAGYARFFTDITISTGQVAYYTQRNA